MSRNDKNRKGLNKFDKKKSTDSYKGKKKFDGKKPFDTKKKNTSRKNAKPVAAKRSIDGKIRLNRFLAQAGICSRREADVLIETGIIEVNGKVTTELGTKVDPYKDEVKHNGSRIKVEGLRYVVLNKPKDFITTAKDPKDRKTVMHLVSNACVERIYPVGRLDRNTLGVLLFTNDGNLAEKLTHPRNGISKTYVIEVDKSISYDHIQQLRDGVELEDGTIQVDKISYVDKSNKQAAILTIHSGRNRIVRRMFEHFDYKVNKLDRMDFAGISKKGLKRGQWRHLEEKEIAFLKMM